MKVKLHSTSHSSSSNDNQISNQNGHRDALLEGYYSFVDHDLVDYLK